MLGLFPDLHEIFRVQDVQAGQRGDLVMQVLDQFRGKGFDNVSEGGPVELIRLGDGDVSVKDGQAFGKRLVALDIGFHGSRTVEKFLVRREHVIILHLVMMVEGGEDDAIEMQECFDLSRFHRGGMVPG